MLINLLNMNIMINYSSQINVKKRKYYLKFKILYLLYTLKIKIT